jgi:hypothetical protein
LEAKKVDLTVATYLVYLATAVPLTVWVARALHRYGEVFLADVFAGDTQLAHAVNQLLVIGFYLLNFGYVAMFMTSHGTVQNSRRMMEVLSMKVGAVALVVGLMHFGNVWAFNAFRRRAILRAKALPPFEPNYYVPVDSGAGWPPPYSSAPPYPAAPPYPGAAAPAAPAPVPAVPASGHTAAPAASPASGAGTARPRHRAAPGR